MGFWGDVCIYTKQQTDKPLVLLKEIIQYVKMQKGAKIIPIRTNPPYVDWNYIKRREYLIERNIQGLLTLEEYEEFAKDPYAAEDEDSFPVTEEPEQAIQYYQEGTQLTLLIDKCELGNQVYEIIERNFDEKILGNFHPCEVSLYMGEHDLYEAANESIFFARTFFSLRIGGQGCPNDWDMAREMIANLPEMKQICQEISQIAGSVGICAFWS